MNVTKIFFKTIQIILGIFVVSFAGLLFANHFGNVKFLNPYVVQSGSMEPAIPVGSVVFSIPQKNYLQGDIITFAPEGNTKKLVTHRIAHKKYPEGIQEEPIYITAGDANEEFDRWEVSPSHIVGRVEATVPRLGYAVEFAKTPQGFILFVIIPATIVIYEELKNLLNEIKKFFLSLWARHTTRHSGLDPESASSGSREEMLKQVQHDVRTTNHKSLLTNSLFLLPIFGACFVLIAFTKGYFFDEEESGANVIGVSTNYSPTPTLTEITPIEEVTITLTPTPTL